MKHQAVVLSVIVALSTATAIHLRASTPHPKPQAVGKQNAAQLIADAEKALALTVKSARENGKELAATTPTAKPFLKSLKDTSKALDQAKKALATKDKSFFTAINAAKAGVTEMQVTWDLTKSKDAKVIASAKKLSASVSALQDNYNPLAQRKTKGGDLTAAEKENFKKLKAQQVVIEKKVKALELKAKKDPALAAGLKEIHQKSREIAKAPETVNSYVDSMALLSTLSGLIGGYDYYLEPSERAEWAPIEDSTTEWETYETSPGSEYDWSYTETSVEVYDNLEVEISVTEMETEESYIEDTSFEMTESETNEVAEESSEISEEEIADDEMESDTEEAADSEDDQEMDTADDDNGGDDDSSSDDDGGSDDGGGDSDSN